MPQEYLTVVQNGIDRYQEKTGVLPIKNSEMDTPIYEKYKIDFKKMRNAGTLSLIPSNAFENGGTNLYVLVNVEVEPQVKLLDLTSYQQIVDIQRQVNVYRSKNNGAIPAGEPLNEHVYVLDFDKLGMKAQSIRSPYTRGQTLRVIIDNEGKVAIDYAAEIMRMMQEHVGEPIDPEYDLREMLVAKSYYVPAHSFSYYWRDHQPVMGEY